MWLWILSALFLALVWAAWYILRPVGDVPAPELFPTWVAITITAVVVLALVALVVYRRVRAARAARALEKAIAQQAQEQVLATKPEDRPEIQELQRRMFEGIKALKASKLGVAGGNALYSLPWYAIVGPPGAGKTTALRHSGLSFPFLDPTGSGVKGVGGTRNCEWWFTNEAILLDTAGRYTMEQADHDEWMAFLDMLKTNRPAKPLNGVVVAVAVSDLIDASEEEIQAVGARVRERVDEMQETLQMVLPVYVLFTKTDLVAGFVEFFGDLRRSDRGQAWGTTLPLSADKSDPAAIFDREFDLLVEKLHERTIRRMGSDRGSRRERERIYQFPLEFAAVKGNLARFVGAAFKLAPPPTGKRKKPAVGSPILRGIYFTSGTQEGKPLDRVVGAMGRAFGLRPVDKDDAPAVEPKSYFLKDVFTGIIFPDQDLAARSEHELRRKRLQRYMVAVGAAIVALFLMIPAIYSFVQNRALIGETKRVSDEAAEINWVDGQPATAKVDRLDRLRGHLELLDQYRENGAPVSYRWGMYQGNKLFDPTLQQYVSSLKRGFIDPVKARLETQLKQVTGAKFNEEYETLKTYLLLDNRVPPAGNLAHLEPLADWQISRLTHVWADILRPTTQLSEDDLRAKLEPHVTYYVNLLRRSIVAGPEIDQALVQQARDILGRVGSSQRYYDQFVTVLIDQKADDVGAESGALKYPPITLKEMFADRPDVLAKISSRRKNREGKWQEVRGPYTARGRDAVLANLEGGPELLEREKWVVPLSNEEKQLGTKIKKALGQVRQDYDAQYIAEWTDFFRDIDVAIPQNNQESIEEFRVLATPDWPYWRLLRALKDNTQFAKPKAEDAAGPGGSKDGVVDQIKRRVQNKVSSRVGADVSRLGPIGGSGPKEPVDPVPDKFKSMCDYAFPAPPKEGEPPPPSKLGEYVKSLEGLTGEMTVLEEGPPSSDTKNATAMFQKTVAETEGQVLSLDHTGQLLMRDLLMNPLRQSYKAMVKSAGGAASGLWEVTVWPAYRDTIRNRYPFNLAAKRDASYDDAVAFLKPHTGVLWGFYDGYLKGFHNQVDHQFIPQPSLAGNPKPAKPYTPFNANMYNCLERADEITDALFPGRAGEIPKVVFSVNLKTVSPIVSEVVFEVDGQKKLYRNEKEFWKTFEWPGPEGPPGATLTVRGAGGLNEELRREGPWGIYRLFEAGTTTANKDDDKMFTVEWQMTAPPVTVVVQVKPQRANHPFAPSFFRNLNCPESIGDRFGAPPGG